MATEKTLKSVSEILPDKVLMAREILESEFTTIDIVNDMYIEWFQDVYESIWKTIGLASWIGLA